MKGCSGPWAASARKRSLPFPRGRAAPRHPPQPSRRSRRRGRRGVGRDGAAGQMQAECSRLRLAVDTGTYSDELSRQATMSSQATKTRPAPQPVTDAHEGEPQEREGARRDEKRRRLRAARPNAISAPRPASSRQTPRPLRAIPPGGRPLRRREVAGPQRGRECEQTARALQRLRRRSQRTDDTSAAQPSPTNRLGGGGAEHAKSQARELGRGQIVRGH